MRKISLHLHYIAWIPNKQRIKKINKEEDYFLYYLQKSFILPHKKSQILNLLWAWISNSALSIQAETSTKSQNNGENISKSILSYIVSHVCINI